MPATLTTQGTWCLRKDLSTGMADGFAIAVAANNVTIDCNNFKVGGLAAGDGTITLGISGESHLNTTIPNCNIRGFVAGIYLGSGGGHLVENNTLDGNTHAGVMLDQSADSTVRGNRVIGTGGSTRVLGRAYGIFAVGADIIDNDINGVVPTPDAGGDAFAYGIYTFANSSYSIIGNRIRGLVAAGNPAALGVFKHGPGHVIVRDNDMQGGQAHSFGVYCEDGPGTARDNVITGFGTAVDNCKSEFNTINVN